MNFTILHAIDTLVEVHALHEDLALLNFDAPIFGVQWISFVIMTLNVCVQVFRFYASLEHCFLAFEVMVHSKWFELPEAELLIFIVVNQRLLEPAIVTATYWSILFYFILFGD